LLDQPAARRELDESLSAEARASRRLVLAAVMMAIFMAAIDLSIVATAMPTIVAELGGFHLFSWTFTAYLLAQAVTIPIIEGSPKRRQRFSSATTFSAISIEK
jgi:MFS family permease